MGEGWSHEELSASVEAYVDMLLKEQAGQPVIKKDYYRNLATKFNRTEKAFEYRMQNISYVRSLMGRSWVKGLKPAKNVGARIAAEIEKLLASVEGKTPLAIAFFEASVREELKKGSMVLPTGNRTPKTVLTEATQYQRNARVKAWVLAQANGICERCGRPAPFKAPDGLPYLEVHHIRQLADGGSDTLTNAIALCPNCHRELHYGMNAQLAVERLYAQVSRLKKE